MTYLSCSSLFLWEYPLTEITAILREAGIRSIEFWPETPEFWLERDDKLRRAALTEALSTLEYVSIHTPILDLNPSSYNDLVACATLEETQWAIALASEIGAQPLTMHPGKRTVGREPTPRDRRLFEDYIEAVVETARKYGVQISIENLAPERPNLCSSPDEVGDILDRYPIGFTLDMGHALLGGLEQALRYIEFADRIVNLHIDVEKDDTHYPPSLDIDSVAPILMALLDTGYDGPLTLEIDDQAYAENLTRGDKVEVLRQERAMIEELMEAR